ncbi:MarR family winged helix-turn-helix transcriptional regulator [Streptomyces sp. NPDC047002]|uniref:MarR family winged helix-turn-helix transcriptional regulator n=1 Tax=Streptomyces sp. NPDC047002 TaxID=3155475 RepID=UPI003454B770
MDLSGVFDDLVRLETDLWNTLDAELRRETGVPLGSLEVLRVVARTDSCRVGDIAAALSITIGGASQAVDRLARRELCRRRPHPADRRSTVVELTPAGLGLTASAGRVFTGALSSLLADALPEAEFERLGAALAALRAAVSAAAR